MRPVGVPGQEVEAWRSVVPPALHADALALLAYLQAVPEMTPSHCPWCDSPEMTVFASAKRTARCRHCRRHFNAWSGTPFAGSRHHHLWEVYARLRLGGTDRHRAGQLTGQSYDACRYRERIIGQILAERWPRLGAWWALAMSGRREAPVCRTTPFTSKEDALAHHNHEYVQCLECGNLFSFLSTHLRKTHQMSAAEYRQKWQIMQQIPLAGLGNRRAHSASIRARIASGDAGMAAQVAAMHETNRHPVRKPAFHPEYVLADYRQRMTGEKLWEQSPATRCIDEATQQEAARRMRARKVSGEKARTLADVFGVSVQT